ncbi:SusC/RagA family TonB-linked outer membrane protein [Sphingobacterium luzhongxinii]|uniref:SusC/RagA family TonB-linked outer membrane protein n=1 Tax=Sphingobacterium luzhongxinii TaxID=2654181 RepID=UPI0013DC617D|nr:TonB-dependent receptor [Sphingobacterium sp. xlx-73]
MDVNLLSKTTQMWGRYVLFLVLIFSTHLAFSQTRISGKVVDEKGKPIPGVSITFGKGGVKSISDAEGGFSVTSDVMPTELSVSSLGYITHKTLVERAQSNIMITLESEDKYLDEVVVVAYGTQKRKDLVGSVAQIKGDELRKTSTMNLNNTLAGRVPGVVALQQSGRPGADGAGLRIRGYQSSGGSSPVVIVDGIQRESFGYLDADEIESISFLKDAVSAAAYGIQGQAGVIIVKTRQGVKGKAQVTYNGSYEVGQNTRFPKFLNGPDYMEWYNTATEVDNDYLSNTGGTPVPLLYSRELIDAVRDGSNTNPLFGNTDWLGMLVGRNSRSQHHSVTASGGGENTRYFTSLSHFDQDGVIKKTDFKRYNVRYNLDFEANEYLSFGLNLGLRQQITKLPGYAPDNIAYMNPFYQAVRMLPNLPTHAPNGLPVSYNSNAGWVNPVSAVEESGYQNYWANIFQGTSHVLFKVPGVKGLEAKVVVAYDYNNQEAKSFTGPYSTMGRAREQVTGDFTLIETAPGMNKTTLRQSFSKTTRLAFNPSLSYNTTINDDHSVGALLLYEWSQKKGNVFSAGASNFPIDLIHEINFGSTDVNDIINPTGSASVDDSRAGYVARVNYAYKGKYLFEGTSRWDASINFAEKDRWRAFPGAGVAWVVSEESFFKDKFTFIDFFKLKSSYGKLGNDRERYGSYAYKYTFSNVRAVNVIGGEVVSAVYTNGFPNPDLQWEVTEKTNVGLESTFLNGKFGFNFEWFYEYTSGILGSIGNLYPPTIGGYHPSLYNIGEFDNRGFDAQLRYNQKFDGLDVRLVGNVTFAKNRYLKLNQAANTPEWQNLIGKPRGTKIGFVTDGFIDTWEEAANTSSPSGGIVAPGFFRYKDLNGDGRITRTDDMTYIGRSNMPELLYGLNIDLAYKGFDFSALLQGAGRSSVSLAGTYEGSSGTSGIDDNTPFTRTFYGYGNSPYFLVENAWRPDNTDAEFPRMTAYKAQLSSHNAHINSGWIRKGDYLRVKSLQLGYTLPQDWTKQAKIQKVRLVATGSNLFTFDYLKYLDPEMPNVNNGFYPQQRVFSFGVNVTF